MDIASVLALAALMITQFSLLWYRLGKLEQTLKNHCDNNHHSSASGGCLGEMKLDEIKETGG